MYLFVLGNNGFIVEIRSFMVERAMVSILTILEMELWLMLRMNYVSQTSFFLVY